MLSITNLAASIDDQKIINNLSLTLKHGSFHAIMGPNGSGKSTLAHVVAGNPVYRVDHGSITIDGTEITGLTPHARARRGIFLSFQQPPAIPGLTVFNLLKEIHQATAEHPMELELLYMTILSYCQLLKLDKSFLDRSCNDGFSGGEKKRLELLQMLLLAPKYVILDEIDSGLDIDGLKLVQKVIAQMRRTQKDLVIILITHYPNILEYLQPDHIHILVNGAIVSSGDSSIAVAIQKQGYHGYLKTNQS